MLHIMPTIVIGPVLLIILTFLQEQLNISPPENKLISRLIMNGNEDGVDRETDVPRFWTGVLRVPTSQPSSRPHGKRASKGVRNLCPGCFRGPY